MVRLDSVRASTLMSIMAMDHSREEAMTSSPPMSISFDARPQDDERAEEADEDRGPPAPAEHLAQEQRAEECREQRRGEGERRGARDRRHRQADEERTPSTPR